MKQIIFVTGNQTKVLHANEVLEKHGYQAVSQKMDLIEPREEEPEKVVVEKAVQAFAKLNKPLIVEDAGIFIKSLGGFPKTFVHFAQDTIGMKGILKLMEGVEDRSAEFKQSLAYIEPGMDGPIVFSYVDGGYAVSEKIFEAKDRAEFDKILVPPGEKVPLSMFIKEENAKRDAANNKGKIHYEQLALWLSNRGVK